MQHVIEHCKNWVRCNNTISKNLSLDYQRLFPFAPFVRLVIFTFFNTSINFIFITPIMVVLKQFIWTSVRLLKDCSSENLEYITTNLCRNDSSTIMLMTLRSQNLNFDHFLQVFDTFLTDRPTIRPIYQCWEALMLLGRSLKNKF